MTFKGPFQPKPSYDSTKNKDEMPQVAWATSPGRTYRWVGVAQLPLTLLADSHAVAVSYLQPSWLELKLQFKNAIQQVEEADEITWTLDMLHCKDWFCRLPLSCGTQDATCNFMHILILKGKLSFKNLCIRNFSTFVCVESVESTHRTRSSVKTISAELSGEKDFFWL